ncbi:MAG: insulinase family protein [Nitrospinota bacterium]|nr:insulinase family protein [Nitrospinota bacterium]
MKSGLFRIATIAVLISACATAGGVKRSDLEKIKYPELQFKPPVTERVVLKNGMVLHLLENHELPMVDIVSLVRVGEIFEPLDKRGLAAITGGTWRSGGTESMPPDILDENLEFIAASIETSISSKSGSISMSVMKKDLEEGLGILAEIIRKPAFNEKRFEVVKNNMLESIKRENDDPQEISTREFMRMLLPEHHYGNPATVETVSGITRNDCIKFYRDYIGADSFIFGITGDFDSKEIVAKFEKLFGDMGSAPRKLPPIPQFPEKIKPGNYIIDKKLPQSVIKMGHLGVGRNDPDYYPVRVMNYIVGGGGFSSRMVQDIRSTRGLAYSVYSYYSGGNWDQGVFIAGGETKAASAYELIEASREIFREVIKNGVSDEELSMAKESIINSYVFDFDKDIEIVSNYINLEYFELPKDYIEKFRENIDMVTREKILEVASKYLHPDEMVIMAVGDRSGMGENMMKLGEVKEIKLKK